MANTPYGSKGLYKSVESLIKSVQALIVAATPVKGAIGAARVVDPAKDAEKRKKLKKSIKASWDRYTPKERAARIRKMLAGRGLKPKKK